VEWVRGQRLVVEAHPGYWGPEPAVKTLVIRPILDVGTAIAEMLAGGVDFIRLVPPDQIPVIEASGRAYITSAPIIRVIFLNFDVAGRAGTSPVQNLKVRQAISHAVDVDGIIQHVLGGRGLRVGTMVNPMKFGYDASIKPVPYDPGRAKQLLAEAGQASGMKLDFMTYSGSIIASRQVGDAVAGYLSKVGIQTNRQHIEDIGLILEPRADWQAEGHLHGELGELVGVRRRHDPVPAVPLERGLRVRPGSQARPVARRRPEHRRPAQAHGSLLAGSAVRRRERAGLPDVRPDLGDGGVQPHQLQGGLRRDDRPLAGDLEALSRHGSSRRA
jgi:hypothetical protein